MVKWLAIVAMSCQGTGDAPPRVETGSAAVKSAPAPALALDAAARHELEPEGSARIKPDEPDVPDVSAQLADLGAIPAWDAVVDRTRYLARRGQHGVVFGTLGDAIMMPAPGTAAATGGVDAGGMIDAGSIASPYMWLVDDTEGNGALAIRIELGAHAAKQGDRIAVAGAWALDADHRWFWKATGVTPLPPVTATSKDPPAAPGHTIATGELPAGVRAISVAKDGDLAYFTLVGSPPASEGDGWPVGDELGSPLIALIQLPGESASYGAQDLRASDERWQLRRGQTYWVRLGHFHKHGDKPTTVGARTAPIRVK